MRVEYVDRPRYAPACMAATSTSTQSRARSLPARSTCGPSVRSMRLRQRVRRAAPQRLRAFVRGDEAELAMPSVDELMLLLQAKRLGQGLQCVPHLLIAAWIAPRRWSGLRQRITRAPSPPTLTTLSVQAPRSPVGRPRRPDGP